MNIAWFPQHDPDYENILTFYTMEKLYQNPDCRTPRKTVMPKNREFILFLAD